MFACCSAVSRETNRDESDRGEIRAAENEIFSPESPSREGIRSRVTTPDRILCLYALSIMLTGDRGRGLSRTREASATRSDSGNFFPKRHALVIFRRSTRDVESSALRRYPMSAVVSRRWNFVGFICRCVRDPVNICYTGLCSLLLPHRRSTERIRARFNASEENALGTVDARARSCLILQPQRVTRVTDRLTDSRQFERGRTFTNEERLTNATYN